MDISNIPKWMKELEEEDLAFIRKFVLCLHLKEMAEQYKVTYPTVRLRLDRLIQKIELGEKTGRPLYHFDQEPGAEEQRFPSMPRSSHREQIPHYV